jgi:hypothetical protein
MKFNITVKLDNGDVLHSFKLTLSPTSKIGNLKHLIQKNLYNIPISLLHINYGIKQRVVNSDKMIDVFGEKRNIIITFSDKFNTILKQLNVYLTTKPTIKPLTSKYRINSTQFMDKQSKIDLTERKQNMYLRFYKLFLILHIKQDLRIISDAEKIPHIGEIPNKNLAEIVEEELKQPIPDYKIVKYYNLLFFINVVKSSYRNNHHLESIIQYIQGKAEQQKKLCNHPIVYIESKIESLRNVVNELHDEKPYEHVPIYNYSPIISTGGATPSENYKNIRKLLEQIAEPKHDFGKKKRAHKVYKNFRASYRGIPYDLDKELKWGVFSEPELNSINSNISSSKFNVATNWFTSLIRKFTSINIKKLCKSTEMEAMLFNSLFMVHQFSNPLQTDIVYYNKFRFYNFDPSKLSFRQALFKAGDKSESTIIQADLIEYLNTLLKADNMEYYVRDTTSGMLHASKLLQGIDLIQLFPLVNIWDPGSISLQNYKDSPNPGDDDIINNTYMSNLKESEDNLEDSRRQSLRNIYTIDKNVDANASTHPVRLNIKDGSYINLDTGFSVYELSEIIDAVHDKANTLDDRNTNLEGERLSVANQLLGKLYTKFGNFQSDKQINKAIRVLLDLKKTGDWGQVQWVNKFNGVYKHSRCLFVSGDKLCSLYSILNQNPTLFGSTRQITRSIMGTVGDENIEILLGHFSGTDQPINLSYISSELDFIRNQFLKDSIIIFGGTDLLEYSEIEGLMREHISTNFFITLRDLPIPDNIKSIISSSTIDIDHSICHILFNDTGIFRKTYNELIQITDEGAIHPTNHMKDITNLKLLTEIIINIAQLSKYNIDNLIGIVNTINNTVVQTIGASIFDGSLDDSDIRKIIEESAALDIFIDNTAIFNTGVAGVAASTVRKRRSVRVVSQIDNWVQTRLDLDMQEKEDADTCDELNIRRRDGAPESIGNIIENMGKLMKIYNELDQLRYIYETMPNIYSNTIQLINQVDHRQYREIGGTENTILRDLLIFVTIYEFTKQGLQSDDNSNIFPDGGARVFNVAGGRCLEISAYSDILDNNDAGVMRKRSDDVYMFEHLSNKINSSVYYLNCILDKYETILQEDGENIKYINLVNFIETFDKLNIIFR